MYTIRKTFLAFCIVIFLWNSYIAIKSDYFIEHYSFIFYT